MCYLYHYTTAEGFRGIIESQELWATSIYHLNDWTEFEHGRDAFIEGAKVLMKDEKAVDAAAQLLSYLHDQSILPCLYARFQPRRTVTTSRSGEHTPPRVVAPSVFQLRNF